MRRMGALIGDFHTTTVCLLGVNRIADARMVQRCIRSTPSGREVVTCGKKHARKHGCISAHTAAPPNSSI